MAYSNNRTQNTRKASSPAKTAPRWTNVSGLMTIFGHSKETKNGKPFTVYSTAISRKDDEGSWDNVWMDVIFSKDCNPDMLDRFEVDIRDGFLSLRVWDDKNGHHAVPCVVITAFDLA